MGRAQLRWNAGSGLARPQAGFTPPLASGIRATSTTVGYFADYGALTTYNPGGAAPTGWTWDGNSLVTTTDNAVLNLAQVNGGVVATHANPTVTKCKVIVPAGEIFCVTLAATGKGTLTVSDTTVVGSLGGANPQVNGISSDSSLDCRRCHVTQSGDGIHFTGITGTIVSQCYVGPLRFTDEAQHCDGMQHFQDTVDGSFTVAHTYIEYTASTPVGTSYNSALTMGPPSEIGALYTPTINNNYFGGGLFHLRFNHRGRNCVVSDNDFGVVHGDEFGLHEFDTGNGSTYTTWSNNRDSDGNLIPAP